MKVRYLTPTQREELVNAMYQPDSYFNPIQDCYNEWIISEEEVNQCINPYFMWVKDLPEIDYCPKTDPPLTGDTEGYLGT